MPKPGWYQDPQNPQRKRWWDGAQWTDHVQAPAQTKGIGDFIGGLVGPGEPCVRSGLVGLQSSSLDACGAQIHSPELGPGRLKKARTGFHIRSGLVILFLVPFFVISVFTLITVIRFHSIAGFIFLLFALPFPLVAWWTFKFFRQPVKNLDSSFLLTAPEAYGVPAGSMVTVTGIVEEGETTGVWGDAQCVWTSFVFSQGDTNGVYRSSGRIWLGDGRGGAARILADLSYASCEPIGDPGHAYPNAKAWALRIGDEISLTGELQRMADGTVAMGGPPPLWGEHTASIQSVLIGHPSAAYADNEKRASQIGDLDDARGAFGGRPGPSVVVLPRGAYPSVR